jgi:hypothetical protein
MVGEWYCNGLATGQGVSWWERALVTIDENGVFSGNTTDSDGETGPVSGTMHLSSSGQVTPMMPGQHLLTANASGIGGGGLVSSDGAVFFSYPSDSEGFTAFTPGAALTLTALADSRSIVAWSGDCASTGGTSEVATCTAATTTGGAKGITALFSLKPVRIAETMAYFTTVQGACDAATNNQNIQIQTGTYNEDLNLTNTNAVLLKGGYNPDFSPGSSWSAIDGTLTISGGPVTIDHLEI